MSKDKIDRKLLDEALSEAFEMHDLERMLYYELDTRLDEITKQDNLPKVIFEVIKFFDKRGRLEELVKVAYSERPNNSKLRQLTDEAIEEKQKILEQNHRLAIDVARLAKEQYYATQTQEDLRVEIDRINQRLERIIGKHSHIVSEEQAYLIKQAAQEIAQRLSSQSGKNEEGRVFHELCLRSLAISYKAIPASRFDEEMDWLRNWWCDLSGEDEPSF